MSFTAAHYERRHQLGGPSAGSLCAQFSPDRMYVAIGGYDADVLVYSTNAGWDKPAVVLNSTMTEGRSLKSPVTSLNFRPSAAGVSAAKNVLLVTSSDGGVSHWHLGSQKQLHAFHEEGNQVLAANYSPDGHHFVTAGSDSTVRIYDESNNKLILSLRDSSELGRPAHSGRIQSLKWIDENVIATGGWDYTIQIWDRRQATPIRSIFGPYLTGDGLDVHGTVLATASSREKDALELWDWTKGEKMSVIEWPEDPTGLKGSTSAKLKPGEPTPHDDMLLMSSLMTAKFSHSGRFLAAGGHNDYRIFDLQGNNAVVGEIEKEGTKHCVFHTAFSEDDKGVLVTTAGPEVYVLERTK